MSIKVASGWTPPENYFSQDDGTYPVTLLRIGVTDAQGNFTPFGTRTYEGQYGEKVMQDWTFALDNGEVIESSVAAPKTAKDGSMTIHPKSKYFGYITALVGKTPTEGTEFEPEALVGLKGLATIARDEGGFPRITNLGAMPTAARPAPAPAPAPQPLREQVASEPVGNLPF